MVRHVKRMWPGVTLIVAAVLMFIGASAFASNAAPAEIELDGQQYTEFKTWAEDKGYSVSVSKDKSASAVEYTYSLSQNGEKMGTVSVSVVDDEIAAVMCDQEFATLGNGQQQAFTAGNGTVYVQGEALLQALEE